VNQADNEGRVRHETVGHVLKITIDNPSKRNAFVPQMILEMSEALTLLDRDPKLWAGVVCAEGKHFTAGLDMPKFIGPSATAYEEPPDNVDALQVRKVCRKPVVTAVQGIVFTIGVELMLAGDIVVASEDARFCQMETRRGIAPFGGGHFRWLMRAGWGDTMYHLMLADEFGAAEAYRMGLVQEVVPVGQQVERAMELAGMIAANAPLGVQVTKMAARRFIEVGETAAAAAIPEIRATVMDTEDAKEGVRSFIERRPAVFRGE
jgi:enoyl-CoA hydratase